MAPVLTNGIEVKLQRNALSVIEAPTGQDDDDAECENMQWNIRDLASDDSRKPHRPRHHPHKTIGSPDKTMSHANSCDSQYMDSISPPQGATKVDFSKLETEALWKYWRHFDLSCPEQEQVTGTITSFFVSKGLILWWQAGMVVRRNESCVRLLRMKQEEEQLYDMRQRSQPLILYRPKPNRPTPTPIRLFIK
ncbi:hypothetical protein ACLOJK_041119 [Asimina triloba]